MLNLLPASVREDPTIGWGCNVDNQRPGTANKVWLRVLVVVFHIDQRLSDPLP